MDINTINQFISWKENQKISYRGGKKMYDIKHHKWLDESELLSYWMTINGF